MKNLLKAGLAISAIVLAQTGPTYAANDGHRGKLGAALGYVAKKAERNAALPQDDAGRLTDKSSLGRVGTNNDLVIAKVSADGFVTIDAVASGDTKDLVVTIESLGGKNVSAFGRVVSAKVPAERLNDLASSSYLAFVKPVAATTNIGSVTTQGDRSMRTNFTRASYGLTGAGMTIGVLSDSFACDPGSLNDAGVYTTPAQDFANRDISRKTIILSDWDGEDCIDEGRGMAQLIQDVLPEARIAFHTAFDGQADFADGIIELAKAGADVIVDDVIYFAEPMLQDGIIAQAADQVAAWGIPYFSSIGNSGRDSYESAYRPITKRITNIAGKWHDFHPGADVDTLATFRTGPLGADRQVLNPILSFQWDSPNFSVSGGDGAQNDVDIIIFDSDGRRVPECFDSDDNYVPPVHKGLCKFKGSDGGDGGDAIEVVELLDFVGNQEIEIGFFTQSGDAPGFVKFVMLRDPLIPIEYGLGASTGYGHSNASGAESVGASAFFFTEEFIGDPSTDTLRAAAGEEDCVPACLNDFSSAGGVPILFDLEGNRIAEPEIRIKPGVTGPDGGNTSFFSRDTIRDDDDGDGVFETDEDGEFPNFFGTSASAPHVAALVGQLIDWEGSHSRIEREMRGSSNAYFHICKLSGQSNLRADGTTEYIREGDVADMLDSGQILLRSCEATEPAALYQVIRDTAQNMSVRAENNSGQTIQTFTDVDESGFDFDSGYGFVDAKAALRHFSNGRTQRNR